MPFSLARSSILACTGAHRAVTRGCRVPACARICSSARGLRIARHALELAPANAVRPATEWRLLDPSETNAWEHQAFAAPRDWAIVVAR